MYSTMWFMSIVALLVVDVRTGALQQKDVEARRCYLCYANDTTTCDQPAVGSSVVCPAERPYCATVAIAPNFTSSLTCAAEAESPCSLTYSNKQTLEMTCVCTAHHCNAPFTLTLRNELLNFSLPDVPSNMTDLTENFFNVSSFANTSETQIYNAVTIPNPTEAPVPVNASEVTTVVVTTTTEKVKKDAPRAEALKHEATEPSDDDEDDGEGSGAYDDTRGQRQAASAPAAPSSFLPANENNANILHLNLIVTTPILLNLIL